MTSATCGIRRAVTLLEVLVSIAIMGLLMALLLPAVQSARESGRRAKCMNHLRQLALANHLHHDAWRHFPSGGWGYRWIGQADRGFDPLQPGGWIYNVLPYIEQAPLRALGEGQSPQAAAERTRLLSTPVEVLFCPSRRTPGVYPYLGTIPLANVPLPQHAAKCDYAGNGGDTQIEHHGGGPPSLNPSEVDAYQWPNTAPLTGIFFVRSKVTFGMIRDGASSTLLLGDKHVSLDPHNADNRDPGDDQTAYIGDDKDIRRWTDLPPRRDSVALRATAFGSPHPSGCNFAFADGGVRHVAYEVDAETFRLLGNRRDGTPVHVEGL